MRGKRDGKWHGQHLKALRYQDVHMAVFCSFFPPEDIISPQSIIISPVVSLTSRHPAKSVVSHCERLLALRVESPEHRCKHGTALCQRTGLQTWKQKGTWISQCHALLSCPMTQLSCVLLIWRWIALMSICGCVWTVEIIRPTVSDVIHVQYCRGWISTLVIQYEQKAEAFLVL